MGEALAAVDCGTNSTRLLVADPDGSTLERLMVITRLGQGVDRHRRLAPEAIERTVSVLRSYREVMERRGVGRARAVATSAVRDATNGAEFRSAAADALGVEPEVLAGEEEGRLSYAGATAGLDPAAGPYLVVDIGGGSTELVLGTDGPPRAVSLDVGCVRVTERFLASDPPRPAELADARAHVVSQLDRAAAELGRPGGCRLIGLAGTVSTAALLDAGAPTYSRAAVHHRDLGAGAVRGLLDRLASMDAAARRRVPGIEPDRADVIVGGLVVLDTVMDHLGFDRCTASESDILDGIVLDLAG